MRLSKLPEGIAIYGDTAFRGKCPAESAEQVTFFNWIRREYPATWGRLAFHPRNEGLKKANQFAAVQRHAAEGMTPGAPDIMIPARRAFVCELKRRDPTLSEVSQDQVDYLTAAHAAGAFACIALGVDAAREAFAEWLKAL
jgi:hypothetical protein